MHTTCVHGCVYIWGLYTTRYNRGFLESLFDHPIVLKITQSVYSTVQYTHVHVHVHAVLRVAKCKILKVLLCERASAVCIFLPPRSLHVSDPPLLILTAISWSVFFWPSPSTTIFFSSWMETFPSFCPIASVLSKKSSYNFFWAAAIFLSGPFGSVKLVGRSVRESIFILYVLQ